MFSPKLYEVVKITAKEIFKRDFNVEVDEKTYLIRQQDNMMFRQIRLVTGNTKIYNPYIIFVDCKGVKSKKDEVYKLAMEGFMFNGRHFIASERSASMTRNAIVGFIDESISEEIDKRITMDLPMTETVLSKYCAYRGLMFSSCHCLEGYLPKMIVVPDYEKVIKDQNIKHLVEKEIEYTDKETGEIRTWKTKDIQTDIMDVPLNVFDGAGICHPEITRQVQQIIGMEELPTSWMLRGCYIKGLLHEIDYTTFYKERGITHIKDIWGKEHSVEEPMIILTQSMYKGYKYFKEKGTYEDWEEYWRRFKKYEHCLGVAKWNFTEEMEPVYTRANYQILQDLDLDFDDFKQLARTSIEWASKIVDGDALYTYCFLGLSNDNPRMLNCYTKAIMKNPHMMYEESIRAFFKQQLKKYIDKMKCGKIYIKACYKFWVPDLIMMLEWIGGDKNPKGALKAGEIWSKGYKGEYLIERNPHISKSEHLVSTAVETPDLQKYCGHLVNTVITNGYDLSAPRLNGSDFDGDLVLIVDEPLMIKGVDRNAPIVLNLDEKLTALSEPITKEGKTALILRTLVSLIGEVSNAASCYHNKCPKTDDTRRKYQSYIEILSIVNSFAIDFAKTGYIMQIPYHIAKYSKPFPYFMRYISDYYEHLYKMGEKSSAGAKFSMSRSNMNQLSFFIEKFHDKEIKWKIKGCDFDHHIMMDDTIEVDEEIEKQIEEKYKQFQRDVKQMSTLEKKLHNYDEYKEELGDWTKQEAINYQTNWQSFFDKYRNECEKICPDKKMLANIAVKICYEKYPKKTKKFLWKVAAEGVLSNIDQMNFSLPVKDPNGNFIYLGKRYNIHVWAGEEKIKKEGDVNNIV